MNDLTCVSIQLDIGEDPSLYILLVKDGTINRKGNGTPKTDNPLVIGMTDTAPLITGLNAMITEDFAQYLNKEYDLTEKKGMSCELKIILSDDSKTTGTKFSYGSESEGPPRVVRDFVVKAIALTDPWYLPQLKTQSPKRNHWWKFWSKRVKDSVNVPG